MSFAREKRLLLGFLALVTPLPLPFNQALEWWFLLLYTLLVVFFIQRTERGLMRPFSNLTLNALGLVYLPFLALDLQRAVMRSSFLEPLLHLILFLVVVKLFALRREKEKWHITVAVFFVFIGAMATSSHLTIVAYLVGFLVLAMVVLGRFAHLYVLAAVGHERRAPAARMPQRLPVAAATVLILLVAVPLFATLPRFRDPFIFGQGAGDTLRTTGFSDVVDLDLTSSIRGNRDVVMRLQFDGGGPPGSELRFKAATYGRYQGRRWNRTPQLGVPVNAAGGRFRLGRATPVASAEVYLEPLRSRSLVLPLEAVAVERLAMPNLYRDPGGAYALPLIPRKALAFRVEMAAQPVIAANPGPAQGPGSPLDVSGLTPRMRALAASTMGQGSAEQRVDRLERHMLTSYTYTLDFVGRSGESPLEAFLFEHQSGHCELFASAMVLMLRGEGIPARLVAGFLDAEHNPLQGYYIVRQDNAHAWVEAYTPERGWRVYDPTPPDGRPSADPWSLRLAFTQLWDYLIFRWDRYVLSFGSDDQASFFGSLRDTLAGWWRALVGLLGEDPEPVPAAPSSDALDEVVTPAPATGVRSASWLALLATPLLAAAALGLIAWRRRAALTAAAAYDRLRQLLAIAGCELNAAMPPLHVERLAVERFPAAAGETRRLVGLYLHESFGGRDLSSRERGRVRAALDTVIAAMRADRRQRRRR